jgi:adenylate cyclase
MAGPDVPPEIPPDLPTGPGAGRTLRDLATRLDLTPDAIAAAEADGTLFLAVIERLVTREEAEFTQDDLVARTGLGDEARRFWRALGFPDPAPGEAAFTAADVEMLQFVDAMIRLGYVEHGNAVQLTRVIGLAMQRVAQAQVDAIVQRMSHDDPAADPELAALRAESAVSIMPRVLEYAWRRHLQSAIRRSTMVEEVGEEGPAPRAVGFADLVGFTAISQQLDDAELAGVVDRFETTAYDIVSSFGGRVVKMIGDEVMFEVADPGAGVLIGLALSDAFRQDDSVNDIRVGLAHGPVLAREGDLFGPTVNLASRLVGIAYAGAVVVDNEVREALADDARFAFKTLRARNLKHIGRVHLYAARRADDTSEGVAERARRRRRTFAVRLADLVERDASDDTDGGEEE